MPILKPEISGFSINKAERRLNEIHEESERSRKSKMSQKSGLENTSSRGNSGSPPAEKDRKMPEVVDIGEDREEEYSLCNESIAEITVKHMTTLVLSWWWWAPVKS